ncbi:hypothetical protein GCM10023353_16940 [Tomitella cavernea]|uniref:Uncharacterized protein n=1 Tax=Tomitella cavernea TaxID=1387982 RepID=A0ABP9CJS9_9ACTN
MRAWPSTLSQPWRNGSTWASNCARVGFESMDMYRGGAVGAAGCAVQFESPRRVADPRFVPAEPVGGVALSVLVARDDLQPRVLQRVGLATGHGLAGHPIGPCVRAVADGARVAGRPDGSGGRDACGVVDEGAQPFGPGGGSRNERQAGGGGGSGDERAQRIATRQFHGDLPPDPVRVCVVTRVMVVV